MVFGRREPGLHLIVEEYSLNTLLLALRHHGKFVSPAQWD